MRSEEEIRKKIQWARRASEAMEAVGLGYSAEWLDGYFHALKWVLEKK